MRGMFAPSAQREPIEALVASGIPSIQWNGSTVTQVPPNALIRYAWFAGVTGFRFSTMFQVRNLTTGVQEFQQSVSVNLAGYSWLDANAPHNEGTYVFDGDYPNGPTITFVVTSSAPNPNPGAPNTATLLKYALIGTAAIAGTYILVTVVSNRGKK